MNPKLEISELWNQLASETYDSVNFQRKSAKTRKIQENKPYICEKTHFSDDYTHDYDHFYGDFDDELIVFDMDFNHSP